MSARPPFRLDAGLPLQSILRQRLALASLVGSGSAMGLLLWAFGPASFAQQPQLLLLFALPIAAAWAAIRLVMERNAHQGRVAYYEEVLAERERDLRAADDHLRERHEQLVRTIQREKELRTRSEAADRAKTRFLSAIGSELGEPLTELQGSVRLLLEGNLSPAEREYARAIRHGLGRAQATLQELVDFAQLEAQQLELVDSDLQLRELIEELLEQLSGEARARGQRLSYLLGNGVPEVLHGDAQRMSQLLRHLLRHAMARAGKGDLSLRAERLSPPLAAEALTLQLTDSGPAHHLTDDESLGLSVARRIIETMGGSLQIKHSGREGSSYRITLPLRPGDLQTTPASELDLGSARILVAFHSAPTRLQLIQQMRSWNCQPLAASDGPAAQAALRAAQQADRPIQLVLADAELPGAEGLTLLHAVQQDGNLGAPRVVLCASPHDEKSWELIGDCEDCLRLALPIRREPLRAALYAALRSPAPQQAATIQRTADAVNELAKQHDDAAPRLLLVDDNAVNRRVARLMLDKAGYEIDEARDGQEAIEAASSRRYDLILMDVHMPRRNGYEATQAIRAREGAGRRVPILAMTARAMGDDVQECLDAGMDGYVSKPVRGPALLAAVESWVEKDVSYDNSLVDDEPEQDGELPVLASGALDELRGYGDQQDNSILLELAGMFFRGAAEHIGVMREALAAGDRTPFERSAHTLKGSSGTLGARRLAELCRQLEENARNGQLPEDPGVIAELESMVDDIRGALETKLGIVVH